MPLDSILSRRTLLAAAPLYSALRLLRGQQPPAFSADVRVVNLFATVRNKKGQIVRGLSKEDFLLEDDGKSQTIQYFSRESDLPLTLGLLVDTSQSQRGVLSEERGASYKFFDQVLRPDRDRAFVIHFERQVELLEDLTSSREKLEKALALLETGDAGGRPQLGRRDDPQGGPGQDPGGPGRGQRMGGTSLYDAIFLACDEIIRKQTGRKALVLLSDGVDTSSKVSLTEAISSAQRADALVYPVRFADTESRGGAMRGPSIGLPGGIGGRGGRGGRGGGGGGPMGGGRSQGGPQRADGKKTLERIALETGGRYFEASRKQTITQIFSAIEEELRSLYNLGFAPPAGNGAAYHKIRLTTKVKDCTVQTREGYYGASGA
jgi:VWFA-related protein